MIEIKVLLENTSISSNFTPKHGLSIAIYTGSSNILLDVGPDKTFYENANKMQCNIEQIETLILSHSHIDHAGGLNKFVEVNKRAEILLFDKYDSKYFTKIIGPLKISVGIKCNDAATKRIKTISSNQQIDEKTTFIRNNSTHYKKPTFNKTLYKAIGKNYTLDNFEHEGILVIDDGELVIFNSCSHNGIYNSIASVKNIFKGKKIRSYIGGLHYTNPFTKQHENTIELDTLIDFVKTEGIKLYSGHCTGKYCIKYLKKELGDKFVTIATGSELFV